MNIRFRRSLLAAICLALAVPAMAQDANQRIVHQGFLERSGAPVTTPQQFRLNLYTSVSGGTPVNATPYGFTSVDVNGGEYALAFDLHYSLLTLGQLWLEISVRPAGSTGAWSTLAPRSAIATQAQAQHAFVADSAAQLAPGSVGAAHIVQAEVQRRVGGVCSGGQVMRAIGATGSATCVSPAGSNVVQEVITGSGVAGGGNSGTVWVEIANAGITDNLYSSNSIADVDIAPNAVGTAALADAAVTAAKTIRSQVQARIADSCPIGKGIVRVSADDASVVCGVTSLAGSYNNEASGASSSILGGRSNTAAGANAVVLHGDGAQALGTASVTFEDDATASGNQSVAVGADSTASGNWSTAPSSSSCAGGHYSVALGQGAKIRPGSESGIAGNGCTGVASSGSNGDTGTFLFNGGNGNYTSTGDDRFIVRAAGGFYFGGSGAPSVNIRNNSFLDTSTNARLTNGGNWNNASSRAFKQAFSAVDTRALLDRVLALPLGRWQYLGAAAEGWHLGPAAEDFFDAFDLGASAQHITTVDASGVTLAAVQGLAARIEETQRATLEELEQENTRLHAELARLAARLDRLHGRSTEVTP